MFSLRCKSFLLCLAALFALTKALSKEDKSTRVYGGEKIPISEVPYLVQLRFISTGYFYCGGTLVNPTQVVTAAHCLAGYYAEKEFYVRAGVTSIYDNGTESLISSYVVHPTFNTACGFDNDVAILNLATPLEGKNIRPMGLCQDHLKPGDYMNIAGWGVTHAGYQASEIHAARVPVIEFEECEKRYARTKLSKNMICATVPGKIDACPGDSGSAAVYRGRMCGIVSWGWGCANPEYPGVYTDVMAVRPFLEKHLKSWL